jgi:hypothetical protein
MPSGNDFSVTVAMNGYQPVTVPVRPESPGGKLQPNPVYVELQPSAPPGAGRKTPAKGRQGKRRQFNNKINRFVSIKAVRTARSVTLCAIVATGT